MPEPRYEYVRIGLPLPVDVFVTIGDLFDKAWPGAQIITDPAACGVPREFWPRGREQLIRLDVSRRPRKVSKKVAQEVADGNAPEDDDEFVPVTGGIGDDGWVRLSAPEELQHLLGAMCHRILEESEGVINYLEWSVIDPETGTRTVISAARSKGQTPHALRQEADARIARVRALVDRWKTEAGERGPDDTLHTDGVVAMLEQALA